MRACSLTFPRGQIVIRAVLPVGLIAAWSLVPGSVFAQQLMPFPASIDAQIRPLPPVDDFDNSIVPTQFPMLPGSGGPTFPAPPFDPISQGISTAQVPPPPAPDNQPPANPSPEPAVESASDVVEEVPAEETKKTARKRRTTTPRRCRPSSKRRTGFSAKRLVGTAACKSASMARSATPRRETFTSAPTANARKAIAFLRSTSNTATPGKTASKPSSGSIPNGVMSGRLTNPAGRSFCTARSNTTSSSHLTSA